MEIYSVVSKIHIIFNAAAQILHRMCQCHHSRGSKKERGHMYGVLTISFSFFHILTECFLCRACWLPDSVLLTSTNAVCIWSISTSLRGICPIYSKLYIWDVIIIIAGLNQLQMHPHQAHKVIIHWLNMHFTGNVFEVIALLCTFIYCRKLKSWYKPSFFSHNGAD